jgi:DNA primase
MTTPKPDQIRRYFESRLQGQQLGFTAEVKVRCPFHDDQTPSMSLNLEKGVWKCHAGCGGGGLLDFETKFSSCDLDTARASVAELLGDKQAFFFKQTPEAVYQYHDASGILLFEKLRYPGKRFVQRKPKGENGWDYKLGDCERPLYRLPEVLVANEILICEGEKDADNVRALNLGNRGTGIFVAATTNFDGAGNWRDEYAPYFLGKKVVVLADNDAAGRKHAEQVARSVVQHAAGVKVLALPGLPEKGDVSDYLKTHTAADLVAEIKSAPMWRPAAEESEPFFVGALSFASRARKD